MFKSLDEYIKQNNNKLIKLHLGCGSKYWNTWCNIDANPIEDSDTHRGFMEEKPDLWADIQKLSCKRDSIDVICSHHVLEHFYRYEVIEMLKNFYEILKPGGILVTEMPNLNGILKLLFWMPIKPCYIEDYKNRDIIKSQLYGASWEKNSKGYPYHKYIWEKKEFCEVLKKIGFLEVLSTGATKSHVPFRDMAVIFQKPNNSNTNKNAYDLDIVWKKKYGNKFHRFKVQTITIVKLFLKALNFRF